MDATCQYISVNWSKYVIINLNSHLRWLNKHSVNSLGLIFLYQIQFKFIQIQIAILFPNVSDINKDY